VSTEKSRGLGRMQLSVKGREECLGETKGEGVTKGNEFLHRSGLWGFKGVRSTGKRKSE